MITIFKATFDETLAIRLLVYLATFAIGFITWWRLEHKVYGWFYKQIARHLFEEE